MAACGAKVLHLRCVEYARRYNMPDPRPLLLQPEGRARGSSRTEQKGTRVEQAIIAGVAHDRSEAKITVVGVPDKVGEAAAIFETLADAEINIDMIVQNVSAAATGLTDISFTLPREDGQAAIERAGERIKDEVGYDSLLYDDQIGKVSLIGAGMRSHPGITARFFAALADAGVNIEMISTSEIRISVDRRRGPGRRRRHRRPHGLRPRRRRGRGRRLRRDRPMTPPLRPAHVAIVGATGQVGERDAPHPAASATFPVASIRFFASARSAGTHDRLGRPGDHRRGRRDRRLRRASTSRCSPPAPPPRGRSRRGSPRPAPS